jgi:hypothetical protein
METKNQTKENKMKCKPGDKKTLLLTSNINDTKTVSLGVTINFDMSGYELTKDEFEKAKKVLMDGEKRLYMDGCLGEDYTKSLCDGTNPGVFSINYFTKNKVKMVTIYADPIK